MFIENANAQHPRHCDFFLRCRSYRGELPTVAGLLLYPDIPAKMETTSREAFCFKSIPQQVRVKGNKSDQNTQQQSQCHHPTPSRQTGRGNTGMSSRDSTQGQSAGTHHAETREMQSQYQKDFPPPSSCRRRRTPALPQPDNIGINPAFRIEFNTIQREAFPQWPTVTSGCVGRQKVASPAQTNTDSY